MGGNFNFKGFSLLIQERKPVNSFFLLCSFIVLIRICFIIRNIPSGFVIMFILDLWYPCFSYTNFPQFCTHQWRISRNPRPPNPNRSPHCRPSPPPPSLHPLLLGRYELGKLLGHGTSAKVYHALNHLTGESVAIKVLDKEKILKSGLVAHTKREISILRRVGHPNIVELFEVMATKFKIYFVMEYVLGCELFRKVAKGRLKEDTARSSS